MTKFEEYKLPKYLQSNLKKNGFVTCTPIQEAVLSVAFSGKDVIGIAKTGSGKTLGFLLPALRDLTFSHDKYPRILILVPTRELVGQITEVIEQLIEKMNFKVLPIVGGKNINTQKQQVYEGCDIIVATPGRVYDLAMTGILRFKNIKKLILDEYDEMFELGFRPQIERILDLLPSNRQNLLFSATYNENVEILAKTYFNFPKLIRAEGQAMVNRKVEHISYPVPNFFTKVNFLRNILRDTDLKKVFVFVKSRKIADKLAEELADTYPDYFGVIHSNKSQNYRMRIIDEIKSGEIKGLIATDLVARGIDVPDVTHVINFDLPESLDQFTHRVGRTGRMEKKGVTISFISEEDFEIFDEIMESEKFDIEIREFPSDIPVSEKLLPQEMPEDPFEGPS